jgi:hypothetical protein
MPFLPTVATVVLLATASLFCPNGQSTPPAPAARMIPAVGEATLAIAEPAAPVAEPAPRPPAVIAFSEIYPLTVAPADPTTTAAIPAPSALRAASAGPARPSRRVAATGRRPCAGRRCQETPAQDNPFAPARQGAEDPTNAEATNRPVPSALPFAETVAEAVVPVAREVGAGIGARVNQITGAAGDLVRGGQSVVKGSVSILADRLL